MLIRPLGSGSEWIAKPGNGLEMQPIATIFLDKTRVSSFNASPPPPAHSLDDQVSNKGR